jgi:hypothetical protein
MLTRSFNLKWSFRLQKQSICIEYNVHAKQGELEIDLDHVLIKKKLLHETEPNNNSSSGLFSFHKIYNSKIEKF